ncbi:MAG: cytochrome c oxidase subunit II [Alphaproteobacteria bacterium]|nr:cytochrome c oxidase subunit II [Alphaproteobacteria bacterium]
MTKTSSTKVSAIGAMTVSKAVFLVFCTLIATLILTLGFDVSGALAADPIPGQLNLPIGANDLAVMLNAFHDDLLLPICFGIPIFVLVLMVYTCWRFSEKRNPNPSTTTHHAMLEVVWTVVPVLILGVLFIPSMRVLYASDKALDYAFTVKVVGNQWYWHYDYPDHNNIGFDSYMIATEDLKPGQKRLMEVDNPLVIPEDTPILLQFTANDVLHNWSVSEFGIRVDTVPGQLNEAPLYPIHEPGTYYGFCSELCGDRHSFMPIAVKVVTKAEFTQWLVSAKKQFADARSRADEAVIQLAAK